MELSFYKVQTKTQGKEIVSNLEQAVLEGNMSALDIIANAKAIEFLLKEIFKNKSIKEHCIDEIDNNHNPKNGATAKVVEAGVKWQYKGSAILEAERLAKEYSDALKEAQKIAQKTSTPVEWTHPLTGEVLTIEKAVKSSTTTPQITIAK